MEKMTFRQKLENFWYHNKFATIVVTVFAIFITVSLIQLFTKKSPDANFLYMGPASVAFAGENLIQESMATIMKEDYNGDGEKYVDYIELTALDADEGFNDTEGDFATGYTTMQVQKTVGDSFSAQIIAGDSMIYLLDEQYFNVAKQTGVLMPLSEALGYTPDIAINEYAVYLSDLDIYYLPGIKLLPKSTMLCIRYPVTLTNGKTEVEERERCNLSVFRDMFSYVYPDKPEEIVLPDPVNMSLEEFKSLFTDYVAKKGLSFTEASIETSADVTPEGFFAEVGANLFRVGSSTYLAYRNELYALGKHIGGTGMLDIEVCNFDGDGVNDIIFTYSYKGGDGVVSSASVFNMSSKKETFLSIESPLPLTLEKKSDGEFEIYGVEGELTRHLYTVTVNDGKFEITIKEV
ncbi:MAG: hypothetical protein IKL05_02320 [Clostridia bacterium]|nr:hypothetical protein [Clostridia bacterium]